MTFLLVLAALLAGVHSQTPWPEYCSCAKWVDTILAVRGPVHLYEDIRESDNCFRDFVHCESHCTTQHEDWADSVNDDLTTPPSWDNSTTWGQALCDTYFIVGGELPLLLGFIETRHDPCNYQEFYYTTHLPQKYLCCDILGFHYPCESEQILLAQKKMDEKLPFENYVL